MEVPELRVFSTDVSASTEPPIKSPRMREVWLLQRHYVKVFGVDRDYSFYCAVMSLLQGNTN